MKRFSRQVDFAMVVVGAGLGAITGLWLTAPQIEYQEVKCIWTDIQWSLGSPIAFMFGLNLGAILALCATRQQWARVAGLWMLAVFLLAWRLDSHRHYPVFDFGLVPWWAALLPSCLPIVIAVYLTTQSKLFSALAAPVWIAGAVLANKLVEILFDERIPDSLALRYAQIALGATIATASLCTVVALLARCLPCTASTHAATA